MYYIERERYSYVVSRATTALNCNHRPIGMSLTVLCRARSMVFVRSLCFVCRVMCAIERRLVQTFALNK